ncbi:MAG: hypothetical protein ABFC38_06375 [Methanospirillum sp.]
MRLWVDPPDVALEQGRYTALVAPPEVDRFVTLYGAVLPPRGMSQGAASRRSRPARLIRVGGGRG